MFTLVYNGDAIDWFYDGVLIYLSSVRHPRLWRLSTVLGFFLYCREEIRAFHQSLIWSELFFTPQLGLILQVSLQLTRRMSTLSHHISAVPGDLLPTAVDKPVNT
jgi:hypothetical protein